MGVKQQQWTPTIRRGPIAAEMKSPAPNSVDLPPLLGILNSNRFLFPFCIHTFIISFIQVYGQ